MNRKIFSIVGLIILSILLVGAGFWVGQAYASNNTSGQYGNMMNGQYGSMMNGQSGNIMNGQAGGMMNGQAGGIMNGQYGSMMGNAGMMGMMTGFSGLSDVEPLTITEAETAVTAYLATLDNNNLTLGEIMIFSNNAYAQILDTNTNQGAFEVLVDPTTKNVFPEPGPNMMWNTEYGMSMQSMMGGMGNGMMNGQGAAGMMNGQNGGMMNGQNGGMMGNGVNTANGEITVTAAEAPALAQTYLDNALPGTTADEHADTFPGYYTLHIERDGAVIGMLSVNAYTGDVFLHHWHGDFLEMEDGQ